MRMRFKDSPGLNKENYKQFSLYGWTQPKFQADAPQIQVRNINTVLQVLSGINVKRNSKKFNDLQVTMVMNAMFWT
jgi:hypothetical protein